VRTAIRLVIVLVLGSAALVAAQTPSRAVTAPEIFDATAQAKTATAAVSGKFEVRLRRYTPDFDRQVVETALRQGGYQGFLASLPNVPEVGQLVLNGSEPYSIRYARETVDGGRRTIVLVTNKPVFFLGTSGSDPKSRAGYAVAVIEIQIDNMGRGTGRMAAAARVRPDGNGGVLLDDFAEEPIILTNLTRKPL
jgi:hypothetical protein